MRRAGGATAVAVALALGAVVASGASVAPRPPSGLALDDLMSVSWTLDHGLPGSTLNAVAQTPDGYLWISSYGGLARFDGLDFTVLDGSAIGARGAGGEVEVSGRRFYALLRGPAGDLWIGTQRDGVLAYRDGRFRQFREGLGATVRSLALDSDGRLWAGLSEAGAYRLEGRGFRRAGPAELAGLTVRSILDAGDGTLWFATEGEGVVRWRDGVAEVDRPAGASTVTSLAATADGTLWAGTQEGLMRLDGDGWTPVTGFAGVEVHRLVADPDGGLWVGAATGLLRLGASGRVEALTGPSGRSLGGVNDLAFDHEGGVWLATAAAGLVQLKRARLRSLTRHQGLAPGRISALAELAPGRVLVGAEDGTLQRVERGVVTTLPRVEMVRNQRIRDILVDADGVVWLSSDGGLVRSGTGALRRWRAVPGLPTRQVRLARPARGGGVWVGSRDAGLARLRDGRVETLLDRRSGLLSDFVLSVEEAPGGRLLIGTREGLNVLEPSGELRGLALADGLPGSLVFRTRTDADGVTWVATDGGLARLDGETVGVVTRAQGLGVDAVYDIVEDDAGYAWLSTPMGVLRASREELDAVAGGRLERLEPLRFDEADGMADRECTAAARVLRAADGRLWFPTLDGVAVVDPQALALNPEPPPVHVAGVTVDGREITPGPAVELPAGSQEVVFRFSALSFQAPARVRARYRLEGLESRWHDAGPERQARYTSLPPGDYRFRVVAANNDGVWNEEGATLDVSVAFFFHQRPAVRAAAGLAAVLAALWFFRRRLRAVERRSQRLERLVARQRQAEREREELIRQLESRHEEMQRFAYGLSHDLKSPLITIKGFVGLLGRDLRRGDLERVEADMARIDVAADRMHEMLEQLLEVARVGALEVDPEPVALAELVAEAAEITEGRLRRRGVTLAVASDLPTVRGDRRRLLLVMQNLIDNAAKFMLPDQPDPRIEITARRVGGEYAVEVRDNGRGIEPHHLESVFGLFERVAAEEEGSGIGLAIVQRAVEAHGGRVWIDSAGSGRGATVTFTLPSE